MTTTADLIAATRRHLYAGGRDQLNTLAQTCLVGDTMITLGTSLAALQAGAYLAVDLEVLYVWSVDTNAKTAIVQRGMVGSTSAQHASGSLVYVNPRFTDWQIFAALNDDLTALSAPTSGLFQVKSATISPNGSALAYDLADCLNVLTVEVRPAGDVIRGWYEVREWDLLRAMSTADFASGTAIAFGTAFPVGATVRVRYKTGFTPLAALTDDVATTGLPTTAFDLPPLGAALTVMSDQPNRRVNQNAQGDTRRPEEIPTADVLQAPARLEKLRARRIGEEAARLWQAWPDRQAARGW